MRKLFWTVPDGWSQLIKSAARINDEDVRLREFAELKSEGQRLELHEKRGMFELATPLDRAIVAAVGGLMLFGGVGLLTGWLR